MWPPSLSKRFHHCWRNSLSIGQLFGPLLLSASIHSLSYNQCPSVGWFFFLMFHVTRITDSMTVVTWVFLRFTHQLRVSAVLPFIDDIIALFAHHTFCWPVHPLAHTLVVFLVNSATVNMPMHVVIWVPAVVLLGYIIGRGIHKHVS